MSDVIRALEVNRLIGAEANGALFHARRDMHHLSNAPWRISPAPFVLTRDMWTQLEQIGNDLYEFYKAFDAFFRNSALSAKKNANGGYPFKIMSWGKPIQLIEQGLRYGYRLPQVIRPDLLLRDDGFSCCELDAVPGGLGMLSLLQKVYADVGYGALGTMRANYLKTFGSAFARNSALRILVSEECRDYFPEMQYLSAALRGAGYESATVWYHEQCANGGFKDLQSVYRMFELFDHKNLPRVDDLFTCGRSGKSTLTLTAPPKPWLEEKQMFAWFWEGYLDAYLPEAALPRLRALFPRTWLLNPENSPTIPVTEHHHEDETVRELHAWIDILSYLDSRTKFKKDKSFVVKASGFSERAWGSQSVTIGPDSSAARLSRAIIQGLSSFYSGTAYVLQRFSEASPLDMNWLDLNEKTIRTGRVRARILPYYLLEGDAVHFVGGIVTATPAHTNLIHGTSEAIVAPLMPKAS